MPSSLRILVVLAPILLFGCLSGKSRPGPSERDLLFYSIADDLNAPQLCRKIHPDSVRHGMFLSDECLRSYVLNHGTAAVCDTLHSALVSRGLRAWDRWAGNARRYERELCQLDVKQYAPKSGPAVNQASRQLYGIRAMAQGAHDALLEPGAGARLSGAPQAPQPSYSILDHATAFAELLQSVGLGPDVISRSNETADEAAFAQRRNTYELRVSEQVAAKFLSLAGNPAFLKAALSLPDYNEPLDSRKKREPNDDECFYESLALVSKDAEYCQRISPNAANTYIKTHQWHRPDPPYDTARDRCFRLVAFFKPDRGLCDRIREDSIKGVCKAAIDDTGKNKTFVEAPSANYHPIICERKAMIRLGYLQDDGSFDAITKPPRAELAYFRFYKDVFNRRAQVTPEALVQRLEGATSIAGSVEAAADPSTANPSERQMTDRDRLFRVIAVDFDVPELCERIPLTRWENDRSFIDPQYSRSVCYRDVAEIHSHPGLCLQTQPYHSEALEKGLKEAAARKEVPAAVLALSALWASTTGGDTVAACLAGVHEPIARNLLTSNVPMDGRLLAELGYVDQDYKTFHLIDDPRPKQIEAAIDNAKFSNLWEQYKKLLASPKTIERVKRIPVRKEVFNPLHLRAMNRWEYLFNQMGQNLHSLELCERISWNAGTAGKDSHEFSSARLDCQRGVAEGRLDPRICALPSPRGSKIRLTPDPNDCLRGVEDGRRYMAKPAPGYRLPLQQVWYGEGWKTSLRQDIEDLGFHIQPVDESAYWKPPTVTAGRFYQYLRDEADQSDRDLFVFRVSRLPGD